MSHKVYRINETKYAYYIQGGNFAILEKNKTTGHYESPTSTIENGIMVTFTKMPTLPTQESDDVPVDPELAIALVDYVKSKFFEKDGDYEKSQFHMRQFKKRVFEFQKNRFGGPKIAMPLGSYSIT